MKYLKLFNNIYSLPKYCTFPMSRPSVVYWQISLTRTTIPHIMNTYWRHTEHLISVFDHFHLKNSFCFVINKLMALSDTISYIPKLWCIDAKKCWLYWSIHNNSIYSFLLQIARQSFWQKFTTLEVVSTILKFYSSWKEKGCRASCF